MANDRHDELGRFTSGPNKAKSENVSYEDKFKKAIGVSSPNMIKEKGHVVVNEGEHKGERYDNAEDFKRSTEAEYKKDMADAIRLFEQLPISHGQFNEDWYGNLTPEQRAVIKKMNLAGSVLEAERFSVEQHKAEIIAKYRRGISEEMSSKLSDNEIWENLSLEAKKKLM